MLILTSSPWPGPIPKPAIYLFNVFKLGYIGPGDEALLIPGVDKLIPII